VYGGSNTVERLAVGLILMGLPVAIVVSWLFDFTPTGFVRDEGPPNTLATAEPPPPGVLRDLPGTARTGTPVPRHSIAVLPFVDMSAERDQAYLGEGVAEEILNALVKVTPLRVSGRTSSFSFQNRDLTVSDIGSALCVAHGLTGSIRKHGDK
jgi:hypothetical protein